VQSAHLPGTLEKYANKKKASKFGGSTACKAELRSQ